MGKKSVRKQPQSEASTTSSDSTSLLPILLSSSNAAPPSTKSYGAIPPSAPMKADANGAMAMSTQPPPLPLSQRDTVRRSQVAHSLLHKQNDLEAQLIPASASLRVQLAINASLAINVALAVAKTYAAVTSGSLAVLSSLVDSILDLTSQGLFWYSDKRMHTPSVKYPAGRRRLEPIAVIISATLMGMAGMYYWTGGVCIKSSLTVKLTD